MTIYFLQAASDGPIKIGFTTDSPQSRRKNLQTGCPWPLKLIGAIEGSESQEKQIHLLLSRWKTNGEWFEPHAIVLAAVRTALECGKPTFLEEIEPELDDDGAHPLKKWRDERNLSQAECGELLGVTHVNISRWERGEFMPHRKYWRKIESVTGVSAEQFAERLCEPMEVSQ